MSDTAVHTTRRAALAAGTVLLLLVGLLSAPPARASRNPGAGWDWVAAAVSGSGAEAAVEGVAVDPDGNAYVVGWYSGGSVTLGSTTLPQGIRERPGHVRGLRRIFVAKATASGSWAWATSLPGALAAGAEDPGKGYKITLTADGDAVVAGGADGPVLFTDSDTQTAAGFTTNMDDDDVYTDAMIAKIDSAGVWQWAHGWMGDCSCDWFEVQDMTAGPDSGVVVAMDVDRWYAGDGSGRQLIWIDGDGVEQDRITLPRSDFADDLLISSSADGAGLYMAGTAAAPVALGSTTVPALSPFVARLDTDPVTAARSWQWAAIGDQSAGGALRVYDIDATGNSGAVITGTVRGEVALSSNVGFADQLDGNDHAYAAKVDASGDWVWASAAEGDSSTGAAVAAASDGSVAIAGHIAPDATVHFGVDVLAADSDRRAFVAQYTSGGAVDWAMTADNDPIPNVDAGAQAVAVAAVPGSDQVLVGGHTRADTTTFGDTGIARGGFLAAAAPARAPESEAPATPADVTATAAYRSVTVSWSPVMGAETYSVLVDDTVAVTTGATTTTVKGLSAGSHTVAVAATGPGGGPTSTPSSPLSVSTAGVAALLSDNGLGTHTFEIPMRDLLVAQGFTVHQVSTAQLATYDFTGIDLLATVLASPATLSAVPVPVLTTNATIATARFGMANSSSSGTTVTTVNITADGHPAAAGLTGSQQVVTSGGVHYLNEPVAGDVVTIAGYGTYPTRYPTIALRPAAADGSRTRAGMFALSRPDALNATGKQLLAALVDWLVTDTTPAAPLNLAATAATSTSLAVSWNAAYGADEYRLRWRTTWPTTSAWDDTTTTTATAATLTGLPADAIVEVQARGENASSASHWTDATTVETVPLNGITATVALRRGSLTGWSNAEKAVLARLTNRGVTVVYVTDNQLASYDWTGVDLLVSLQSTSTALTTIPVPVLTTSAAVARDRFEMASGATTVSDTIATITATGTGHQAAGGLTGSNQLLTAGSLGYLYNNLPADLVNIAYPTASTGYRFYPAVALRPAAADGSRTRAAMLATQQYVDRLSPLGGRVFDATIDWLLGS